MVVVVVVDKLLYSIAVVTSTPAWLPPQAATLQTVDLVLLVGQSLEQ
jgi:hypothetical protein